MLFLWLRQCSAKDKGTCNQSLNQVPPAQAQQGTRVLLSALQSRIINKQSDGNMHPTLLFLSLTRGSTCVFSSEAFAEQIIVNMPTGSKYIREVMQQLQLLSIISQLCVSCQVRQKIKKVYLYNIYLYLYISPQNLLCTTCSAPNSRQLAALKELVETKKCHMSICVQKHYYSLNTTKVTGSLLKCQTLKLAP